MSPCHASCLLLPRKTVGLLLEFLDTILMISKLSENHAITEKL